MGDRGNIQVKESASDNGVFFYSHWDGSELPHILALALKRGKGRWGDTAYLSRVIFCELVKGDVDGETGYGISTQECDPEHELIVVDDGAGTVTIGESVWTYSGYIADNA